MIKPIPKLTSEIVQQFWRKVDIGAKNTCWSWKARRSDKGYGNFDIDHIVYKAHRVSLAIAGRRSNRLEVRHLCNNPACVNPQHLRFGTPAENGADTRLSGSQKGGRNPRAKLIESDIPIIRKLAKTNCQLQVGSLFQVSQKTISDIITNRSWTHVKGVATNKQVQTYLKKLKK
jgi:hypothetical protein